ncbi:MAG: DNA-binding response regulator [Pseudopedobacter saltans]|uniref:DNA-binding response regulator n=1 Tax=Pseudopedobacter saltans TaxID=151895 RepID=A0A2W5GDQ5_9SPHI|nr:MAG: DNA-binding response regulator [Pseudopedobacter saltans]
MKAIIVDDEKANIENLQFLLQGNAELNVIATADTIELAKEYIIQHEPDLVFLDIVMGEYTSFDLLQSLPEQNFEIIFVTAFDRFGIQAVKFAALDYILKPIDPEELGKAILKAQKIINQKGKNKKLEFLLDILNQKDQKPNKIVLPLQDEIRYIEIADIVYCEASNTYTYFYLQSGEKILISNPIKEYELMLSPYHFIRTHQSYLVNVAYVRSFVKEDGGYLQLKDKTIIPISRARREYVKEALK